MDRYTKYSFFICLLFGLFVIWDQSYYWRTLEDYSFGYLMPVFVGLVLNERWGDLKDSLNKDTCRLGYIGILLGLLFLSFGGLMRAGHGPLDKTSFLIMIGFAGLVMGFALVLGGRRTMNLLWFPVLIGFVSVPLLQPIEMGLKLFLLNKVTAIVHFAFDLSGFPIGREGSILVLPSGKLGVEEACSGIRSLTASVFVGSFLGVMMLKKLWKKWVLILGGVVLAFLTNILRSIFLTSYAYRYGVDTISGPVHDVAGYSVLGLTCVGLLSLAWVLNLELETD